MQEYDEKMLIELFDGNEIVPPDTGDDAPMEQDLFIPPFTQNAEAVHTPKKNKKKNQRPKKRGGVWALPAYKATYDTYRECQFRFRKCNQDTKPLCREVTGNLKRMMVNIELYHWQVKPKEILAPTLELAIESIVIIRALKDFKEISSKDFAIICRHSSLMMRHMMKWNKHYNASAVRTEEKDNLL